MNSTLSFLTDFLRSHVLDEKIFVVPSYQVGHQIGESLTEAGLYFTTIKKWVAI